MQLLFLDGSALDYTPVTPAERPLGGMQSALCYLTMALAARGHRITLANRTTTPGSYGGVRCVRIDRLDAATLNSFDAVISISTGSKAFRRSGVMRPLVLWTGHDIDQKAVADLHDGTERYFWDKIVLMTNWQANRYRAAFKIKPEQISLLEYAIAPAFENAPRRKAYFFEAGRPPTLFYSSTPFRGLDVLLSAFPTIRKAVPGCEARIYSSLTVYQTAAEQDPYRPLYAWSRAIEGVRYIGSVGQAALAKAMPELDVFAYPSTFQETSCIALMEAMASGCMILSAAVGAVPETAAGFGYLCERAPNSSPDQFAELYAQFAARRIQDAYGNPAQFAARLDEQRAYALKNYSWGRRAAEWETLLGGLSDQPLHTTAPHGTDSCPCGSGQQFKHCCGADA
jgi:glycosyltransferase involved in cell wall biosynthesis